MKKPKITIVTPSFNQGEFLEDTILSVLEQNYPNLEYMIIDGGSNDNSIEIIKKYAKHLSYWVSEKDNGQTHAINKGFKRATGELINWLNSDDLLDIAALNTLSESYSSDIDIYFGDYSAISANSDVLYSRKSAPYNKRSLCWGRQLSSQPAVFFKRNLLESAGYMDESFFFCMDIEFWTRCARNGAKFKQIQSPIGITRVHGDAKTTKYQDVLYKEHKLLMRKYEMLELFKQDSYVEDVYYKFMNRFWRYYSALSRAVVRQDFSFNQATKALDTID